MHCKLCLQDRSLRNSHIIPEFFYKPGYDEKHRINVLSTIQSEKNRYAQKGIRETLLCDDCEQLFSPWEKYVREVFYGGVEKGIYHDREKVILQNINYTSFKLFQLSVLWRSSVASDGFFSRINLGPHEEKIRRMILSNNPGEPYRYCCIMIMITDESKPIDSLIIQPESIKHEGHRIYRFIFGSMMWLYFVSSHTDRLPHKELFINRAGNVIIYKRGMEKVEFIRRFAKELLDKGKLGS